ncbi:MAG: hypothetical protein ACXACF_05320 [Candidatus Hermodarchaeia archaeon]|jgi:hypothetical protein
MADEETSRLLVLIGAIFQLITAIPLLFLGIFFAFIIWPSFFLIPFFLFMLFPAIFLIWGIGCLILAIYWFKWRHDPSAHKSALIATGIVGLVFGGTIGGLLALLGGALALEEKA